MDDMGLEEVRRARDALEQLMTLIPEETNLPVWEYFSRIEIVLDAVEEELLSAS